MAEALPFVSIITLIVCLMILVVAALAFRSARRSTELAEDRMEYLHEEQARLEFLHKERRSLEEELKRERERRLEAEQELKSAERESSGGLKREYDQLRAELEQEREQRLKAQRQAELEKQERLLLLREREQVVEGLKRERAQRLEAQRKAQQEREERERSARQQPEQRADRLERELREPREDQQERSAFGQEGLSGEPQDARKSLWERLFPTWEAEETGGWERGPTSPRESSTPEARASEPTEGQPEDEKPKRGRWLPHPDDVRDRRNLGKGGGG